MCQVATGLCLDLSRNLLLRSGAPSASMSQQTSQVTSSYKQQIKLGCHKNNASKRTSQVMESTLGTLGTSFAINFIPIKTAFKRYDVPQQG